MPIIVIYNIGKIVAVIPMIQIEIFGNTYFSINCKKSHYPEQIIFTKIHVHVILLLMKKLSIISISYGVI